MPLSEHKFDRVISPEILTQIAGRDLLVEHLGYWPLFHDFEVLSISLDRALMSATIHDLRVTFRIFDINRSPLDPERRQGTAELLFQSVDDLHIEGFNHQNPIAGLSIVSAEPMGIAPRFRVKWGGTGMRHEVSFLCERIAVLRVMDLNPYRKALPDL